MPTHDDLTHRRIMGGPLLPVINVTPPSSEDFVGLPLGCWGETMVTVEHQHNEAHKGNFWYAQVRNTTLGAGATLIVGANIPADVYPHWRYEINAGGAVTIDVVEGATLTGGTAVTIFNANRNGPASTFSALKDPALAGGTLIAMGTAASGGGPKAAGGPGGVGVEFICKPSTSYCVRLTNFTNGAIVASIIVGFYIEEEGLCS